MRAGALTVRLGFILFFILFAMVSKPEILLVAGQYTLSDLILALLATISHASSYP